MTLHAPHLPPTPVEHPDVQTLVIEQIRRRHTPIGDQVADDLTARTCTASGDPLRDLYGAMLDALMYAKATQVGDVAEEDLRGIYTVLMGWCSHLRGTLNQHEARS